MPLTPKQLALKLDMTERAVTHRANKGQIPGTIKTGTGTRTRYAFPDEAGKLRAKLAPMREARNRYSVHCTHCGADFTTAATYTAHRNPVRLNGQRSTECLGPERMKRAGLVQDEQGHWRRQPKNQPMPSTKPRQTANAADGMLSERAKPAAPSAGAGTSRTSTPRT